MAFSMKVECTWMSDQKKNMPFQSSKALLKKKKIGALDYFNIQRYLIAIYEYLLNAKVSVGSVGSL
jgi:hypothetical protein